MTAPRFSSKRYKCISIYASKILRIEADRDLGCTRDGNDVVALRKQPGKRNLRGARTVLRANIGESLHQLLRDFEILLFEPWEWNVLPHVRVGKAIAAGLHADLN